MRSKAFEALAGEFDVLIIGGGATGLGIAVDSATRGYRTALVEAGDFAQATSSRATKLVHGGVRYLASGQIHLVYEALHERAVMLRNAPHLVQALPFLLPAYTWIDLPFYGIGLKIYDLLSGKSTMGPTHILGAKSTQQRLPNIAMKGLRGSVLYHDGQFDDARLALALARTAEDHGATVLNYARVTSLVKTGGKLTGAVVKDVETGTEQTVRAKVVINATGIFVDDIREKDDPAIPKLLSVSRGTHIVVEPSFLGSDNAIMIPKTEDGRVIFAIPWGGKVVIGTTDLAATAVEMEPGHEASEIDYLIAHINPYLAMPMARKDILSVFSGLRPLVTGKSATTSKLSREHHIDVSPTGLITVAGGKWTTYRRMAQDTLDFAIRHSMLPNKPCRTREIKIHGAPATGAPESGPLHRYGTDADAIRALIAERPELAAKIDEALPFCLAEVVFSVRQEMARTVEDVLSRRMRALMTDARAAERAAPAVAAAMAEELGLGQDWVAAQVDSFRKLAATFYLP
ncbi:glycerol-3-phosphate dehydrogenase [Granulicella aggregans]|uniref:Glycerol-3-phosphate dehydrogenase n=1 Tax=Granulicella aggregans TaxID=474949 RepID=A0A7W7ZAF4_9BACT|nr:glycerol-3-phosphate dehydrogenase/oxidase [Granulicella aggregans]MBB5056304.1 glycerol-3-phosphate dehydrogenase [Granulicella aggregans]